MSDDAEQAAAAPTPSPQLFGRPPIAAGQVDQASPHADASDNADAPDDDGTETDSRFPGTGDARVDRALAHLPDPEEHRGGDVRAAYAAGDGQAGSGDADDSTGEVDVVNGIGLPDPELLDSHIVDVTSVHRQLQQRLSDLSG